MSVYSGPTGASIPGGEGVAGQLQSARVRAAIRGLTPVQKRHVMNGTFSGDFTMATVRVLNRKGLFYHKTTSPNGQCGPMALTPLGEAVRAVLKARTAGNEGASLSKPK